MIKHKAKKQLTFEDLGEDIVNKIFEYNNLKDQIQFAKVCSLTYENKIKFGYNGKKIILVIHMYGTVDGFEKVYFPELNNFFTKINTLVPKYTNYYLYKKQINSEYKYLMVKNIEEIFVNNNRTYRLFCNNPILYKNNILHLINECYKLSKLTLRELNLFYLQKIKFGKFLKELTIENIEEKNNVNINLSQCTLLKKLDIKTFIINKNIFNNIYFKNLENLSLEIKELNCDINDIRSILNTKNYIKNITLKVYNKSLILLNLIFLNNLHTINLSIEELDIFSLKKNIFLINQDFCDKINHFELNLLMNKKFICYKDFLKYLYLKLNKKIKCLCLSIQIIEEMKIPMDLTVFNLFKKHLIRLFGFFENVEIPHIYVEKNLKPVIFDFFKKYKISNEKIDESIF